MQNGVEGAVEKSGLVGGLVGDLVVLLILVLVVVVDDDDDSGGIVEEDKSGSPFAQATDSRRGTSAFASSTAACAWSMRV